MKSPMIAANPDLLPKETETGAPTNGYTDLQVLRSAAGWYLGTLYREYDAAGEVVWEEPGSRDSDYYRTEEAATKALRVMTALGDDTAAMVMRQHP